MRLLFSIIFSLFTFCFSQFDYTENGDSEEYSSFMNGATDLYNELFNKRQYNKLLSPVYSKAPQNSTSQVPRLNIHFDVYYVKLISLEAQNQVLGVCIELKMYWRDPRLAWNASKFDDIHSFFVLSDAIWLPDSTIGNARTLDSVRADTPRAVEISDNGTIYYPVFYYTEVACPIMINTFPFDKQYCPIPIMSLLYDARFIKSTIAIDPFLDQYTKKENLEEMAKITTLAATSTFASWGNGEWDVTNISTISMQQNGMQIVAIGLNLRRVPNFYVYVIALPCFIVTFLSIVGMFWTPNIKKEQLVKLTIGLTSLVSMSVLLQMLADAIPKTAVFPLLGIYVVCCVGIISLASIVITLHCLPNPKRHHEQQQEEIAKLKEKLEKPTHQRILKLILQIFHRNIFLLIFFSALNLIGFIVFLSFWGK